VAAVEGYNQALVDRNYTELRDRFLHVPFVVVDETPRVITSLEVVVDGLRKTREALDAEGYATTTISSPRVTVLVGDRVLINCRLSHLKQDGSMLTQRANLYVLVKANGMWKIGGIIPQDPAFVER
jgi:hypothetical protein